MKFSTNSTLMATVIATVFGTCGWWFGLFHKIWPAHPFIADFLISLLMVIVIKQVWDREFSPKR